MVNRGVRAALAAVEEASRRRLGGALDSDGIQALHVSSAADLVPLNAAQALDAAVLVFDAELLVSPIELMEVRADLPQLPVTVVVPHADQRIVRKVLRAGAAGVVHLDDADEALAIAVRASLAGQLCLPADARGHAMRPAMSHREKQVLELAARGFTNQQIAHELYLAESTVKSHLSTSFRKLGVRSRAEAAALVLDPDLRAELGLTDLHPVDQLVASA